MEPLDQLRPHFTGLRLQEESPVGQVFAGQDATGTEVVIAVLAGPAAIDPAARGAFAELVWQHSIDAPAGRATVTSADLQAVFPWAATRAPAGAGALLAGVAAPGSPAITGSPAAVGSPAVAGSPAIAEPLGPGGPVRRLGWGNRPGSPWPWLLGAAGGVLLVLLAVAAIAGVQALLSDDPGTPGAGDARGGSVGEPGSADSGLPQLRQVEPVSVLGPTFGPDEQVDPMGFVGWPFAFRTPPGWNCFEEPLEQIPDGDFYRCEDNRGRDQLVALLLWECPTSCTETEQQAMLRAWMDQPEFAVRLDSSPTSYLETGQNRDGRYQVDLGHFVAAEPGGPLRWMVGVYIESPVDTRADVQKVMNDVISQSSR